MKITESTEKEKKTATCFVVDFLIFFCNYL